MTHAHWLPTSEDLELFHRELDTFVPPRLFDAHAHLYDTGHFGAAPTGFVAEGPARAGLQAYRDWMGQLLPGRECPGLFFPFPTPRADFAAANEFLAAELTADPLSRGQMLIHPAMDPEFIRQEVRRLGFAGLKCYHVYAPEAPTWNAPVSAYLPEEHVRIAHEERLSITLHMVRPRALADTVNQEEIRRYATRYPDCRLILAHAGRGFNPHHTVEGIAALRGLGSVWFDGSAVTDAGAYEAILQTMGVERFLYGSDFPVSHLRGRCVALGDSFLWLTAENTALAASYGEVRFTFVLYESLRVLKVAARALRLGDRGLEAIFRTNAAALYGLPA